MKSVVVCSNCLGIINEYGAYQITVSDDEYMESVSRLEKLILLPIKGNMVFKVEEIQNEANQQENRGDSRDKTKAKRKFARWYKEND